MKIAAQNPQNFLSKKNSDPSRLGQKVSSISLADLAARPHGIVFLGLADDTGIQNVGGRPGARLAPTAIREKLYRFTSADFTLPLYDLGNLEPAGEIADTHRQATSIIRQIHQSGHFPIILGGGHDLAYPEALALLEEYEKEPLFFINADAHLDLRNIENGITSGSPWYLLLEHKKYNFKKHSLFEFGIQAHCNTAELLTYAHTHHVKIFWYEKIKKAASRILQRVFASCRSGKILFSLDIDSVRNFEAPGCSAPQTFGFTAEQVVEFCEYAGANKNTASFGLYEVSPPLDIDGRTATLAAHCILAFLRGREKQIGAKMKHGRKKATSIRSRRGH
jgi:formiminoglutamase